MSKVNRMAGIALFVAITVVLQITGSMIRFGSFSIALVLVPIVVGAALFGSKAGALFGGAFGIVVLIGCITGADIGGNMLWVSSPFLTAILCLLKGALAGFAAGLVYTALSKRNEYLGILCAAFVCPIVNTGIFLAAMLLLFRDTLTAWAGGTALLYYTFIGLAGVNFLLELIVNLILAPGALTIIRAVKRHG